MKNRKRRSVNLDITPLIDMMFILIIFFILTSSFVNGKITVDLPSGNGISANAEKTVTVSVDKNGGVLWDGKNVSDSELHALAATAAGYDVLVAGDKGAQYGRVAEILSILKSEGVSSAGLLMQGAK